MTNYHILISDTPSGESESSEEEEEEDEQGHASRPTNGPEQEDEGGLSAAERSDAIADRIRKRRQGRQLNYREGSQDSESEEEPPRQRKRTRRAEATASTASGENTIYYSS